jgi:hypothetical protein
LNRRHQIIKLLDPQHANVPHRGCKPRKTVGQVDSCEHACHSINPLIAKVNTPLLQEKSMLLQNALDFYVRVVVRIAIVGAKGLDVHVKGDGVHPALQRWKVGLRELGFRQRLL